MLLPPSVKVWLASEPVDLRRGHDGLSALVRTQWRQDPYSGHLFVFVGRRKDRVKILF
jgi:transposase